MIAACSLLKTALQSRCGGGPISSVARWATVAVLLSSCSSTPSSSVPSIPGSLPPPVSSTVAPSPATSIVMDLLPAPRDCHGPEPKVLADYFGRAIGGSPVWAIGFGGPQATLSVDSPDQMTSLGRRRKVLWVIEPGTTTPVTLHAASTSSGAPLWFEINGRQPSTSPLLDPAKPDIPIQHGDWREFPSYLLIPAASCYSLSAEWQGGNWTVTFSAGR